MSRKVSGIAAMMVVAASFMACHGMQAEAAASTNTLAHCNWGEIGCNNPPPKAASPAVAIGAPKKATAAGGSAPAAPAQSRPQVLTGGPNRAQACNKDLSSGDECWTNCKTEDDITICDIIKLDTFMPEAPGGGVATNFRAFSGKTVTRTYKGNKTAIGRLMMK